MVRPEKNKTNQLCVEIGYDRKIKLREYALKNRTNITEILIEQIDSILEAEQKNLDAQVSCLGHPIRKKDLTNNTHKTVINFMKQTTIDSFSGWERQDLNEYVINGKRSISLAVMVRDKK